MIVKTHETKVKNTCDQLIAWGFPCSSEARFLVVRADSPEYAIMCEAHKKEFERLYPKAGVEYRAWTLELNQKLAEAAEAFYA